jgi:thymidylate kinase
MTGRPPLRLRSGTSIIFEGLDRTGKSTQIEVLRAALDPVSTLFAHMPSGFVPFTKRVYAALEGQNEQGFADGAEKPASGLAQQLAHLACHAESMGRLVAAVKDGALVLDRWWWSTLAYGWFGGSVEQSGLREASFTDLIRTVWQPIKPSLVFVFLEPHQSDCNNNAGVEAGYRALLAKNTELALLVPNGTTAQVHEFIVAALDGRGVLLSC